ncbi:MAG: hypothetical protein RLZZ618_2518 [Pseudomonadota bacterium]|jgi:diguanylate cyclase
MSNARSWIGLSCGWLLALLAALPCAAAPLAAGAPSTVLPAGQSAVVVTSGVDYLVEEEGKPLTPEEAMGQTRWKRYEGRNINLMRQAQAGWFRLNIENPSGQPAVLAIDWPLLLHVHGFQIDPGTGRPIASYARSPGSMSSAPWHDTAHAFPLQFAEGHATTVLLKVQSRTAMVVPLKVWSVPAYEANRHGHNVLMGMLFGILGIMLFYNTSLLLFTRDRDYAYYSAYLLGAMLYELSLTGYGPLLFWGDSVWLTSNGYGLFAAFTFLMATLFIRSFLEIARTAWPHMRWVTDLLALYWVVCIVVVLFVPQHAPSLRMPLIGALSGLLGIYSSVVQMVRGNASARFFTLGWVVLMVGTMAHTLSLTGLIEGNAFTDYSQHVGFVIEALLLSVALADRIKRDRRASARAQAKSIALTQSVEYEREEKIKAQDEAIALQARARDTLEARVQERTAELDQAMNHLEAANAELARLSVTDALTLVHNRRHFDEVLEREHKHSARTAKPLALLLADIDFFKKINDQCGHLAGDECLRLVAAVLTRTIGRSTDLVARYGGEEFALVLPDTGTEQALAVAERMRLAVAGIEFEYRGMRVPLSISVGVTSKVTDPHERVASFIAEADGALYAAKAAGRNQVKLADGSLGDSP